jgi:putative peptidoglycan lipid II flippase
LQFLVQTPALWRINYRFRPDFKWRDAGVRTVLGLMGPAVIAASAVQVNVLVNSSFASYLERGSVIWLSIAFRLMQLPLGIFGVAISTVTLPLVSRAAAAGDIEGFRSALSHAMRLVMLLTVPSAIGLFLLAEPIIRVIYEHGHVTAYSVSQIAGALRFYAIGLAGYSAVKILAPAFYALDKRYLPMMISFLSIGTNLVLNWIFTFNLGLGHRGLALSTSLVAIINFLLLYGMMRHHTRRLESLAMFSLLAKVAVSGLLLAGVCEAATYLFFNHSLRLWQEIICLGVTIAVAAVAFFASALAMGVDEVRDVLELVKRRVPR